LEKTALGFPLDSQRSLRSDRYSRLRYPRAHIYRLPGWLCSQTHQAALFWRIPLQSNTAFLQQIACRKKAERVFCAPQQQVSACARRFRLGFARQLADGTQTWIARRAELASGRAGLYRTPPLWV